MARPTKRFHFRANVELSPKLGRRSRVATDIQVRLGAREAVAKWLGSYIRKRVQQRGMGSAGALKGYSTRPLRVDTGILNKRVPPGGFPKRYQGGYAEYRADVGLQNSHFALTNTGYSFNNFGASIESGNPSSDISVGFSDARSVQAADEAIKNGREHMFDLNEKEVDRAAAIYLKYVTKALWDSFFEPGPDSVTESTEEGGSYMEADP